MPFGMVSGVGVLDGVVIVEREEAILRVNLARPIVTNDVALPKLLWAGLVIKR